MLERLIRGRSNAEETQQLRVAVEGLRREMHANATTTKADIQWIEQQFSTLQKSRWHNFLLPDLLSAITILGLVLYGCLAFGYSSFYYQLSITMEEVGVGYATILSSTGISLTVIVPLFMTFSIFIIFFGDRAKDHRTKAYRYYAITMVLVGLAAMLAAAFLLHSGDLVYVFGTISTTFAGALLLRSGLGPSPVPAFMSLLRQSWREREPWPTSRREAVGRILSIAFGVLAIAIVLVIAVAYFQRNPGQFWPALLVVTFGAGLMFIPRQGLRNLARDVLPLPRAVLVSILGLLSIMIVLTGAWWGYVLASDVQEFDLPPEQTLAPLIVDVQMIPVCATWIGANSPPNAISANHQLVYLGQSDGTLVLYDPLSRTSLRVNSSNVVLTEARHITRGKPGPC